MRLDPSQEAAVELMLRAPLGVVTGGPGTGKTTTTRRALDELDARGETYLLAAPTGKAARRMEEATGRESQTIHRLLKWGLGIGPSKFFYGEDEPLEADVVIVDEASMIDTKLADPLFAAVQHPTRLILVGDAAQLPSVGAGMVFGDLIRSTRVEVARLTTLHRAAAESWVCSQAPRVLRGEVPDLRGRADFRWHEAEVRDHAVDAVVELAAGDLGGLGVAPEDAQVLVPQNVGPAGADLINRRLQARLNPMRAGLKAWTVGKGEGARELRVGDRVIQTRNDYPRGVMNGEIGVVARADDELVVRFEELVTYDRGGATALRLAYALTVHKYQGSEVPWAVVLCHSTHTQMLTRRLFYTAITRAKRGVVLVGDRAGIERAVKNQSDGKRNTGLIERLDELWSENEGDEEERADDHAA